MRVKYNLKNLFSKEKQNKTKNLKKTKLSTKKEKWTSIHDNPKLKFYTYLYDGDSAEENLNGEEVLRGRNW